MNEKHITDVDLYKDLLYLKDQNKLEDHIKDNLQVIDESTCFEQFESQITEIKKTLQSNPKDAFYLLNSVEKNIKGSVLRRVYSLIAKESELHNKDDLLKKYNEKKYNEVFLGLAYDKKNENIFSQSQIEIIKEFKLYFVGAF